MRRVTAALFVLSIVFVGAGGRPAAADLKEQFERDVDQVASASQEKAIAKLSTLLAKYRNTRQEPMLLLKLADLQQQQSAILFRIAYGYAERPAGPGGKPAKGADMSRFGKVMKQAIGTLTSLITRYPSFPELPRAYAMRAKGYEEIGNKALAAQDYQHLVKHYPQADETPAAYMALAEYAIEANDHPKAISYLNEVEKLPNDLHYPFALYKLGWSHYNLKNIPAALSFLERHIEFYGKRLAAEDPTATESSDKALRENSLLDYTVFFFQGYEDNLPQYHLSEAMPAFKKLEGGPALGKMYLRFAKLLRSHAHDSDLIGWKDQVLLNEHERPESLDVLLVTYEHQLNRRAYPQMIECARDMVKLYQLHPKYESFTAARKQLLETADGLQAVIIKNKDAEGARPLSMTLAAIYDAFTRVVPESDPRVPRVHYNLAETLFAIKDYQGSTEHYRWIVDHGGKQANKVADTRDAALKAVSSRYEVLRQRQLAGKEVTARPLREDKDGKLEPLLAEWIQWVDDLELKSDKEESFLFEANRALYAQAHLRDAVERFKKFADKHPRSTFAIPSASLVIDTLIASAEWQSTYDHARSFAKEKAWKGSEFQTRLGSVAADAAYKLIERIYEDKDYKTAIREVDDFISDYPASARFADSLILAGRAAMQLENKDLARKYFSRLIAESPGSQNVGDALLARAALAEERYELAGAAADNRAYILFATQAKAKPAQGQAASASPAAPVNEDTLNRLRKKALALTWLASDQGELRSALASKTICSDALAADCDRYNALVTLNSPERVGSEEVTSQALEKTKDSSGENRTLWGAVALEGSKHLSYRDRLYLLRQIATGWEESDPLVKFTLLPVLSSSIVRAFQQNRLAMPQIAPLRANERYIARRVEVIREMENSALKVMKLPWARIRSEVLSELAALYLDLSKDLGRLPAPKNLTPEELTAYEDTIRKLVLPFEEKGQELRNKAFELASRSAIEESSFNAIAQPFLAENPSQAKAIRKRASEVEPIGPLRELTPDWLAYGERRADPAVKGTAEAKRDAKADAKAEADEKLAKLLRQLWKNAIAAKRWAQASYFMQQAKEKGVLNPTHMALIRAISLSAAGARAEAVAEIDSLRQELPVREKTELTLWLLKLSLKTLNHTRTQALIKDLQFDQLSTEDAAWVTRIAGQKVSQVVTGETTTSRQ